MTLMVVDSVYPFFQALHGIFLDLPGRSGENRHIHIFKFVDIRHDRNLRGNIGAVAGIAAHNTRHFEIGSLQECLKSELPDVAVSDYGCSNLFHLRCLIHAYTGIGPAYRVYLINYTTKLLIIHKK